MYSSYIFADLINRAIKHHQKKLNKRGQFPKWMDNVQEICKAEIRPHKTTSVEKANAGLLWCEIKQMELTTRQIYFLALCWCLKVKRDIGVEFITDKFKDMFNELEETTVKGINGEVRDADPNECATEWEFITGIVDLVHEFYIDLKTVEADQNYKQYRGENE